jgi:PHD/YefM family antitoxin component YafN of YafNO toxin-antitoxin module
MRILQALASEGGATALSSTSASSRIFARSSRRTAAGRRRSATGSAGGTPCLAKLAYLAHNVVMSTELTELSVSQARDHFSDAVNRAAFGGEITYVTRGRNRQRAAAIVPAELVEQYEAMIDLEDGRIALERLADLEAGRTASVPADEVVRALGL